MLIDFLFLLRSRGLNVSTTEFLALISALRKGLAQSSLKKFYAVCRSLLVKREGDFDLFDRVFAEYFEGVEWSQALPDELLDWLSDPIKANQLTPELLAALEHLDLETLRKRFEETMKEQQERHDGGSRWVGTGGTSPYGHGGHHPTGIRVGGSSRNRSAVQVAQSRRYKSLRSDRILDTRQIGVALRRLKKLKREGARDELDLTETINRSAKNAGDIELIFRPIRENNVKLLLLMDIGGSMDPYASLCERLFSAAHSATHFKRFQSYFFHNCPYNRLYSDMVRLKGRNTQDVIEEVDRSWFLVVVGDAYMHPYELLQAGGAIDYSFQNREPGIAWLQRLRMAVPNSVWLNPEHKRIWRAPSISSIRQIFPMFELSLDGLEEAVSQLRSGAAAHMSPSAPHQ